MQPGAVFPEHEHRQMEQCYVLEGGVTDSDGVTANAGDLRCLSGRKIVFHDLNDLGRRA